MGVYVYPDLNANLVPAPAIVTDIPQRTNGSREVVLVGLINIVATTTAYGFVYGTAANPTLSNTVVAVGTTSSAGQKYQATVTFATGGATYYVRAYYTTAKGTTYGVQQSFVNNYAIGDSAGGGIVFYDSGTTNSWGRYLVAATDDQSAGAKWATATGTNDLASIDPNVATDYGMIPAVSGMGAGKTNQAVLMAAANTNASGLSAYVCANYNGGGYTDWWLPSIEELRQLYAQRLVVGGFSATLYWSSSQYTTSNAWSFSFGSGYTNYTSTTKTNTSAVRAVRGL